MKNLFFELLKVAVGHQSAFYSLSRAHLQKNGLDYIKWQRSMH